jgi:hypothetical protein
LHARGIEAYVIHPTSIPGVVNRMKATLIRFGIRNFKVGLRKADDRLGAQRGPEDEPLPVEHGRRVAYASFASSSKRLRSSGLNG